MEFQKTGIRFGVSRQGRCLLADDMGLGKTLQALTIVAQYEDRGLKNACIDVQDSP